MKKLLCIFLMLLLLATLGGCGGNTAGGNSSGVETGETGDQEGNEEEVLHVNEFGWEVPKETITITYYAGYDDPAEAEKYAEPMAKFYKEKFNVEFKKIVYNVDMVERLNLMLASNDYPEVITWMPDDMAERFIMQGKAIELTPYLEKYGHNITRRLGKYLNLLKTDDGKLYKLPVGWGQNPNVAGWDFAVRYDLWKKAGLPIYKTPEEYYETLKKLMQMYPTNANGEKVYALSDNSQGANLYGAMLGAYGFKNGFKVDEKTGEFTHWINTDEGLEIARYINRFIREGMMDPDFLNNKFEDWQAKVMNERVIGNIGTWWHVWVAGHEAWGQQEGENYNIEKRFMNVTVKAPGVEEHTLLGSNFIGTSRVIMTDKCTQPENVMKWWNWECSELGTMITAFGPPGPENVWDIVDGKWMFKDSTFDNARKNEVFHAVVEKWGGKAYWMVTSGGLLEHPNIDPRVTRVSTYDFWPIKEDGSFLDPGVNICWQYTDGKSWDSTLFTVTFKPDDPITTVKQTIDDTLPSEWAKIIMSKTDAELEANFMAAREKLNSLGLHDLEKFYADSYKANVEKFNQ